MSNLTGKQRLFIEKYLQCWNGVQSAREAGYAGDYSTLGVVAHDNLKNPKIKAEIEKRLSIEAMSADEVLWRLGEQARSFDFGEFSNRGIDGELVIDWEKLKEAGLTHLVKGLVPTKHGTKIIFHDQQKALELIGKRRAMFTEKHEIDSNITLRIVYDGSDSEAEEPT